MKPAHPDPAEILQRVRQQLILAQVRIMELEDVRDEIGSRLSENEKLLQAAQSLADQKLDEVAHSERIRADLQAQCERLQQAHVATQDALEASRAQLRDTQQKFEAQLRDATTRGEQLDAELRAVQSSRSWRWTAWLRGLGRKQP